ncbi:MAG: hypothetical protein EA377_10325 [Phycisphaerales bacterium]|nr:MAG: hypothetical protein EA377_10325 [Phycisphaerales bacterium]
MSKDRLVQLIAAIVLAIAAGGAGALLPGLLEKSDEHALRYTDVSVEGAPPIVAIGTAIGALRGIIVDYLWIKINIRKEQGLYFDIMADAELITQLQPRFAAVWAFHGHNMAYNISVTTHTEQERWEWVNAGIRLVRNRGLRYNPNNLVLHRELSFWFAHKIEGVVDDAHLYYKREFAREWHYVLGEPPVDYESRIEWIRQIAEAPATLREAQRQTPEVRRLLERLNEEFVPIARGGDRLDFDYRFLMEYGQWEAIKAQTETARILGLEERFRRTRPWFVTLDQIAGDPELEEAWETLLLHIRKRVLLDDYNMDPQLMYEYTRDLGPIDWRHGQAHALYWSRRGMQIAERRVLKDDDIYKVLNNDRQQMQAMQDLARSGRITFDPFTVEWPGRSPEPRWHDTIFDMFEHFYAKHYDTRGAGGEGFINFLKNFMGSAIRELYRSGEWARAEELMERLDGFFGTGQAGGPMGADYRWSLPLDVFVRDQVFDQYQYQPHLAPSEVNAALRRGLRVGVGQNRPEVLEQSIQFAEMVTDFFRSHEFHDYETHFGTGRLRDLLGQLENSAEIAFVQLMTDPTIPLQERLTIWRRVDQHELPGLRLRAYDRIQPTLERQFARHPLSTQQSLDQVFPKPPGLEAYRTELARQRQLREQRIEEQRQREDRQRR